MTYAAPLNYQTTFDKVKIQGFYTAYQMGNILTATLQLCYDARYWHWMLKTDFEVDFQIFQ